MKTLKKFFASEVSKPITIAETCYAVVLVMFVTVFIRSWDWAVALIREGEYLPAGGSFVVAMMCYFAIILCVRFAKWKERFANWF